MRASSAISSRSQHSAMSLPPATAAPCTLAMVGLGQCPQAHEVVGVLLHERVVDHRVPGRALLLAGVVDAAFAELRQVVAAAEALARTLDHDDVHLVSATAQSTAARISPGIFSSMAFSRSGRFSSSRAMRGCAASFSMVSVSKAGMASPHGHQRDAISASSKMATARVQPALAPRILCGKQLMKKPLGGSTSRLCSFSMWQ
jgi:hypothetical protein